MTAGARSRTVSRVSAGELGGQPQDAELLARIQAGDDRALGEIYDRHADLVFGLARRVTRDEQLAREISQDVFAYLWELPGRVDLGRGSLRSYLAVVAHRRAVEEVRRCERRNRVEAAAAPAEGEDGPEADVVEEATQDWRKRRLAAVLAQLPADQSAAVRLAYYDGLTYKQVAQALAIPEGTAKSRLRLAMVRLRSLLGDDVRTAF